MDQAPTPVEAQPDGTATELPPPESAAAPTEQTLTISRHFIRCRSGRPRNYCSGSGVVTAIIDGQRVKRLCACVEGSIRAAKALKDAQEADAAHVAELAALAAELPAPPPLEARPVPAGAREKAVRLKDQLARETVRLTGIREEIGAAIAGTADELATLQAEEAQNRRDTAGAEGTKRIAGAQLEELRARLAGLRAQVEEADASLERLRGEAGQFGARRMELEARVKAAKGSRVKDEKASADRVESLEYRYRQHLARWPELAEAPTS